MFTKDQAVNIKHTTLSGVVTGAQVDQTTLEMQFLVEYEDVNGEPQTRYFAASALEAA